MSIKVEDLKAQLAQHEQELENAKAVVYRIDGSMQVLRYLISKAEEAESPTDPKEED